MAEKKKKKWRANEHRNGMGRLKSKKKKKEMKTGKRNKKQKLMLT